MAALSVITLLLTAFTIVFYGYLFKKTEHSVSFFICVEMFAFVANLCTITAGSWMIAILYLIVSAAFLGIGFAIDTRQTIAFYCGMGGWFKTTFTNTALIGWRVLSLLLPPAGVVLYFVWYKEKKELSHECGKMAIWGVLLWLVMIWLILAMISGLTPLPETV